MAVIRVRNDEPSNAMKQLVAQYNDLVAKYNAVLAKLDADGGVTDTNYAATQAGDTINFVAN